MPGVWGLQMSDNASGGTVHVVTAEGEAVYVDYDMDKCRDVAGKITAGHGKSTTIHRNVACNLQPETDQ